MEKRRVVITGMGAVTPLGLTAVDSWAAAKAGVCGIGPITLYDPSAMKVKLAAEVKNFVPEQYMDKREVRKTDRFVQLALAAAREAVEQSGLDMAKEADPYRCATIVSCGVGGMRTMQTECGKGAEKGYDKISPFFVPMIIGNIAPGQIAIKYGLKGMCTCTTTACASGTNAIGDAFHYIRDGYADLAVCGGTEAVVTEMAIGGFTSMRALCTSDDPARASIPFDAERGGFVLGEGAGILVIETLEHAQRRGAAILGEIVGYHSTCDAHHITAPSPDGEAITRAMREAIADAGIDKTAIRYVNAHGTSTPLNDSTETAALKAVFGADAYRIPVSSTKSMTGHLLGAAGAVEAIFSVLTMKDGFLPPTIGYRVPDPACDLDVVPNTGRAADVPYSMSESLGFGGHNAVLVFKRWEG